MEANNEEINWNSFRTAFLEKYFPTSARDEREAQFLTLRQGNMSVPEFAAKLESLAKYFQFFHDHVDERYMCKRFVNGLRLDIEDSVRPLGIMLRSGSQNYQGKGRFQNKKPYQRPAGRGFTSGSYRPMAGTAGGSGDQAVNRNVNCFKCGKLGHYANACTDARPKCFNCDKFGHTASQCRAPKTEPSVNTTRGKRPAAKARVYTMDGEEAEGVDGLIRGNCEIDGSFEELCEVQEGDCKESFEKQAGKPTGEGFSLNTR
ncbi:uncharacterized protein LOC130725153 [Lotus japonicus]|uniref:uncharacterized protein LOC130725153 n=1 Tax=Lotus japonicus TaxID=34305 RepID=UPI002586C289|nr:uncharacterized protein LOC130725153 [Lotus japonicus]